ncbi:sulfite exporter TauE/SafE family protein [Halioglobus maricola]|uniref:Probable membrane transporter protein n=1 Tax=Halioglobus maricola TaxID=2601894 RepID=A0A5P9NNJ8_9GAMM|nr:sulfite exporter TauE/SafE family protein [Halioglobus maricola]QFU76844.1 sulfite exporter TauE/SafE family protein [Halioglobus maricola]
MVFDDIAILSVITLSTSTIAAVFGFGGGMILVATLPNILPVSAIIPVHSAVQLISNSSLAVFSWRSIHWAIVRDHLIGACIGITAAYLLLRDLDLTMTPAIIGAYILISLWSSSFSALMARIESFQILGAIQAGLSLIVGATGSLQLPALLRTLTNHHQVVSTIGVLVTTDHLLKLIIFYAVGFEFIDYAPSIACMSAAAVMGSYCGTLIRRRVDMTRHVWVIKLLLSALAVSAIHGSF